MGKKAAKREKNASEDEPPSYQKKRKPSRKLPIFVFSVLLVGALAWFFRSEEGVAVAPEKVRGPRDAIPEICTQELSSETANRFGVDRQHLPKDAVVHVCLAPPHGRALIVDGFLVPSEIEHMRKVLMSIISRARDFSQPGYRSVYATGLQYPAGILAGGGDQGGARTEKYREDKVLNIVEQRMANFTGVPASMFEDLLQMSHDFPVAHDLRRNPNLHHDKNMGAPRYVTVLTYLTEVPVGGGGHTIFPALAPTPEKPGSQQEWNKTFHEIFRSSFSGMKIGMEWPKVQVGPETPKGSELSSACDAVNRNSLAYFAVRPIPGRAVFFWHEDPDGNPLPEQFHAGCPVLAGEKISLQKFKNFAPDHAKCSWYCKL